jgi:hypothetical protein
MVGSLVDIFCQTILAVNLFYRLAVKIIPIMEWAYAPAPGAERRQLENARKLPERI